MARQDPSWEESATAAQHAAKRARPTRNARPARSDLSAAPQSDCQIINSLARGLKVLAAFGPDDAVLGNKDLALRTGLPKPTISRLTNTLTKLNFLSQDLESGGYMLGEATLILGLTASAKTDLSLVARPLMRAFAEEWQVNVVLGVRDGLEVRGLAYSTTNRYRSSQDAQGVILALAARQPIGASALGYALLAAMPHPARAALFEELARQTGSDGWPNQHKRIEFAITDIDRLGFCSSHREWNRTINAAATPIVVSQPGIPLALSCVDVAARLPENRIRNEIGPALLDLKERILQAHWLHAGAQFPG